MGHLTQCRQNNARLSSHYMISIVDFQTATPVPRLVLWKCMAHCLLCCNSSSLQGGSWLCAVGRLRAYLRLCTARNSSFYLGYVSSTVVPNATHL